MQEALPQAPPFTEGPPEPPQGAAVGTLVELVLDSRRVVGEVRHTGAPRRLVDILNAIDGAFIVLYNGELAGPFLADEQPRRFAVVHVHRDAILFAVPRSGPASPASPLEAVAKVPAPATIVLPGFEISGNVYLPPQTDPARASLLASSHFIPVTEATVVAAQDRGRTWQEPILAVNLARALAYAPNSLP